MRTKLTYRFSGDFRCLVVGGYKVVEALADFGVGRSVNFLPAGYSGS